MYFLHLSIEAHRKNELCNFGFLVVIVNDMHEKIVLEITSQLKVHDFKLCQ